MKSFFKVLFAIIVIASNAPALAQTPPTSVYGIDFFPNNSLGVSAASHARLKFNSGTGAYEISLSGSTYDAMVLRTATQELTNKTMTGQIVKNGLTATGSTANDFSGSTGTFLTSSGANTLSGNVTVSDTKTLTGSFNGNGTSQNIFATIQNTTAATATVQQYSPMECWLGKTWETTGPSSQTGGWCVQAQGFNGTAAHSILTFYENSNGTPTIMLGFRFLSGGGAQLVARDNSDIAVIHSAITVSNQGGTKLAYDNTLVNAGSTLLTLQGAAVDGATATNIQAQTSAAMSTSGAAVMRVVANANTGTYLTVYSGNSTIACAVAVDRIADTGGVTTNKVVVYTGTGIKVQDAAATNNLTTIAGVALNSATAGNVARVCIKGTALTLADAGITTGQLVGTSAAVAGNVQSGTPPALGQVVGRATENTGGTTANRVIVDVTLD